MAALDSVINQLHHVLDPAARTGARDMGAVRYHLRGLLTGVPGALSEDRSGSEGWLSPRFDGADRERMRLAARSRALATQALTRFDPDSLDPEVQRFVADLEHYRQRLHDLSYDGVSVELGGSD